MSLASNIIRIINNDDGYTINEAKTEIKTAIDGTKKEFGIKGINAFNKAETECGKKKGLTAYIIYGCSETNPIAVAFCGKDSGSGLYSCVYTDTKNFNKLIKEYNVNGHNPFEYRWGSYYQEFKPENTPEKTFNTIMKHCDKSQIFYVTGEKLFEKLM